MKWAMGMLVIALLLAGCSGPRGDDAYEAKHAASATVDAVTGQFDYLLFLGITATEGPLDWALYEDALRGASDPGSSIADTFDQDTPNGIPGDGRVGSWLSTHFVFDEDRQLLGGLYTQYSAAGVSSVYAPFRGPYAGTPGLPALQTHGVASILAMRAQEDASGSTLCGIVSSMEPWQVDSVAAATIAAKRPLMQAHIEAFPEGEFTYYYFPKLDVEPGCPAKLMTPSNYWVISHVDLDDYLVGGVPTVAEVRIDAATGEVTSESVRPLYYRAPLSFDLTITGTDPTMPRTVPTTRNASFLLDPLVQTLDISVKRSEAPDIERHAATRLLDPSGRVWDSHAFDDDEHGYRITAPAPGRWTLEYIHQALQPNGAHEIQIHAVASYT